MFFTFFKLYKWMVPYRAKHRNYCSIGQSKKKMVLMNIWIIFQPSQVPFYCEEVELQVLLEIDEEKKGKTVICSIITIFLILELLSCTYPDGKVIFKMSSKDTLAIAYLKPFQANVLFLDPLKTSENLCFLEVFSGGVEMEHYSNIRSDKYSS